MLSKTKNRKAQAFSIDVLLAMVPLMMILGAGLQYLYVTEQDLKDLNYRTEAENILESFSDQVFYEKDFKIDVDTCPNFENRLSSSAFDNLPSGYVYHAFLWDHFTKGQSCKGSKPWSASLSPVSSVLPVALKNTMSTQTRFVVQYDDTTGKILPGHIAEVSLAIWENT